MEIFAIYRSVALQQADSNNDNTAIQFNLSSYLRSVEQ